MERMTDHVSSNASRKKNKKEGIRCRGKQMQKKTDVEEKVEEKEERSEAIGRRKNFKVKRKKEEKEE